MYYTAATSKAILDDALRIERLVWRAVQAMVSLLFSFMVIWDLPNLRRGMKALKTSRLAFAYNTISPQV